MIVIENSGEYIISLNKDEAQIIGVALTDFCDWAKKEAECDKKNLELNPCYKDYFKSFLKKHEEQAKTSETMLHKLINLGIV